MQRQQKQLDQQMNADRKHHTDSILVKILKQKALMTQSDLVAEAKTMLKFPTS